MHNDIPPFVYAILYDISKEQARKCIEKIRARPFLFGSITIIVAGILIITGIYGINRFQAYSAVQEERRLANLDLEQQLEQLDELESNINNLVQFISDQRIRITITQDTIEELKKQQAELQPLVEADLATVEALILVQQKAASRSRWSDITIAFLIGFFTEIFVAVVIAPPLIRKLRAYSDQNPPDPTATQNPPPAP